MSDPRDAAVIATAEALVAFLDALYGDEPLAAGDCWGESELTAAFTAAAPILVAAGRRQAADAIRVEVERMDAVGWQGTADAYEHAARIAEGAPAEPVEGTDRG